MDAFAKRYLPVDGQVFISRSGTWLCRFSGPVDVSGVDRRIFYLEFTLTELDSGWASPTASLRQLELRTSLASFVHDPSYAGWLHLVIDGFLDSDRIEHAQEAYEVERGPQP